MCIIEIRDNLHKLLTQKSKKKNLNINDFIISLIYREKNLFQKINNLAENKGMNREEYIQYLVSG